MKCKVFKIHLQNEFDEVKLNKFLANVDLKQVFASVVNEEGNFWSILAFYEDEKPFAKTEKPKSISTQPPIQSKEILSPTINNPVASAFNELKVSENVAPAPEPIVLSPEQEKNLAALKKWRSDRANEDGLPAYMIAHNESLMQIAALPVKTKEDLLQIKGFGEKRAQKYGDEIMQVLASNE